MSSHPGEQNAAKDKSKFVSKFIHELRNPLTAVKMAVDILLHQTVGQINADQRSVLGRANDHIDRLNHLMTDVATLVKLEAGELPLNSAPARMDEVIRSAMEASLPAAQRKGIAITAEFRDALPAVFDADKIKKMFTGLLDYIIQILQEGRICISPAVAPGVAGTLKIKIDFQGIFPEGGAIQNVFKPFLCLAENPAGSGKPTGLEMAIARAVAARHGGEIEIRFEEKGQASFNITLPAER